jgi:hypothetical protein
MKKRRLRLRAEIQAGQGKTSGFYVGKCWFIFGFPGLVGQSKRQSGGTPQRPAALK